MHRQLSFVLLLVFSFFIACSFGTSSMVAAALPERADVKKLMRQGNYKEAYDGFRQLVLNPETEDRLVGQDLHHAINCLQRLNRFNEIDALIEAVVEVHHKNWRLLSAAAQSYQNIPHYGFMIAGQFERGPHRGGGKVVNSAERDRVRGLQLLQQALPLVKDDPQRHEVAEFYLQLARLLLNNRGHHEAWRLQYLTDLSELPDYDEGYGYRGSRTSGAPADEQGNPVLHHVPESWEAAKTDGERWRWTLVQAVEASPTKLNEVRYERASFLLHQFGVQTMREYGYFFGRRVVEEEQEKDESGIYEVHTLSDGETIAKLAIGIRRFELPDEFNFIKLFEQIVEDDKTGYGEQALTQLATIYENRRQYPTAAKTWRRNIEKYGRSDHKQSRLNQIIGNWGRFEQVSVQPAGQGATVEFRFRNAENVQFEAHSLKTRKLLEDVKAYLKQGQGRIDWQKMQIGNIGYRIVQQNQREYLGEKVAGWELELDPAADHYDRRITVNTPLQKAGAYLLTAKLPDGNVSKIILWVSDTAIVKKALKDQSYHFVCDAVTGKPIAKANVEFFGFYLEHQGKGNYRRHIKQFAEFTDDKGQVTVKPESHNYQWIITATTDDDRLAYLGFSRIWAANYHDAQYNAVKTFAITDRPVYRPGDEVQYKFWVRHAQYDKENVSQFADQTFTVELRNPKGEKVQTKQITSDEYGGLEGSYKLPEDATLGNYNLQVQNHGGGSFRVEEYKKPEFEVTVEAPEKPVALGEKVTATIKANYYFGAPVVNAKVKYKVLRTAYNDTWYPIAPWDWLYGRGYWWFAYEYPWYPGWDEWGCKRPTPWWYWRAPTPPEVVAERETEIRPDGTVQVEIDTALAQAMHPDQDHSYQIVAEVVDQSRRTIVGKGKVLVARRPFKVFAWVDRGYYRVGDVISANFSARTLDDQPVQGDGELTIYKITYDENGQPEEVPARTWDLDTDAQGYAEIKMRASLRGQFRLSYKVTDDAGHTIEGGYLFTIIGEGFDGADFRFNELELIPDKQDYAPGENVRLQVNTNRIGSTVLLFVRAANGAYLPPEVLQLKGKSTTVEIPVTMKDMPNFFVEALTVSGADVYTQVKEIHVPPEKRVLNVKVVASSETYRPGEKAKVTLKLTDHEGLAFIGSTVLAIYDKSVEYISGGSNVPEIKEFFWKWRRRHNAQTESSLGRQFGNMTLPGHPGMSYLGVFGATVADQVEQLGLGRSDRDRKGQGVGFGGAGAPMKAARLSGAPAVANGVAADSLMAQEESLEAADKRSEERAKDASGPAEGELVEPTVRTNFADTALWRAALTTNSDGLVDVELDMPENLTTWKIKAWAMGHGTKVGQGETEVITRKNLIVRLQAPRFFVQKDEVVLSANVHNYLSEKKQVRVLLELEGGTLEPMDELARTVSIDADGEARVDWRVKATAEGEAIVRMKALSDEESDAMQMTFPVYVHGMLKMDAFSGVVRRDEESNKFTFIVPDERRPEQSRLEVRYSPTLAGAMVDALPYLIDYPHGCTEQTLNRFLPAVITQNILLEMNLDLAAIQKKRTNLNAQEIGDDQKRAEGWKRYERNPVFDQAELRKIVKDGVQRLTEMQVADGGWGWFSGYGEKSYPHTTAVVVHGLQIAKENDVALVPGLLERGVKWLERYQSRQIQLLENAKTKKKPYKLHADNLDALVYMVLVDAGTKSDAMRDFLYRDRTHLAVYSLATYGLALHKQGEKEKRDMVMRNISQYVVQDDENQTAWLNLPEGHWWYWYGSEYEAHAYYLKLLSATEPKSQVASRMVKYLLNNRKHATYWNSTRDTALVIEAMADYLKASGEYKPDMTVEVWIDGEKRQSVHIEPQDLFTFDNKVVLEGKELTTGEHTVELRRQGEGPLYWNAYQTNFTLEDPITKAGLEIKVARDYYRLVPVDKEIKVAGSRGQVLDQKVEKYKREPLANLALLKSGEMVEVELVIESKNDYEYLLFEDMKAAGFEPVEVRSGYSGNELGAYMELRDERVTFFVRRLARGRHSVSYRLRAEIPGRFSALPAKGSAMYAPELKANSDEMKLRIED